jgi:hypothetical protein
VGSYLFFAPVEEAAIPMSSTVAAEPVTVWLIDGLFWQRC